MHEKAAQTNLRGLRLSAATLGLVTRDPELDEQTLFDKLLAVRPAPPRD